MNIDPTMIQAILGSGESDPQAEILRQQQARANMMRKQGMQQAPGIQAGRVYNANIGGQLGNVMQGIQANRMQPDIDAGQRALADRTTQARKGYMDAMTMAMRKQYPQPQSPMLPPDGMEDR